MGKREKSKPVTEPEKQFTEAYFKTMAEADDLETNKNKADKLEILSELFEQELQQKDLTEEERQELVARYRNYIIKNETRQKKLRTTRNKIIKFRLLTVLSAIGIAMLIYINTYYPFTAVSEIEESLNYYVSQVDNGYGAYSEKFYASLDKYGFKLNKMQIGQYNEKMHRELEENFNALIEKLESGEIRYYDDAKEWASYFPEEEERLAKEEMVDNALGKGVSKTIDDGVNKLFDGTGNILKRTWKTIKQGAGDLLQ